MKKIKGMLFALTLLCLSFTTSTQGQGKHYNPYINAGASVSSGVTSLGGELGLYNNKAWAAVGASTTSSEKGSYYLSAKYYRKLTNTKEDNIIDIFAWSAVNLAVDRTHALSFEPGAALVWNATKKFAPQISISSPIGEGTVFNNRAWPLVGGISLNYWIR